MFQSGGKKPVEEFSDSQYLGSSCITVVVSDKATDAAKESSDDKEGEKKA